MGPFHAMVDVTRRRNMHWVGCRFHSSVVQWPTLSDPRVQDMSFEIFEKICLQLSDADTRVLFLMGEGEPLLNPEIFRMVALCKELELHVAVISSGIWWMVAYVRRSHSGILRVD